MLEAAGVEFIDAEAGRPGCGYGCLKAAVRYVHRESRHIRGAFRGRLGHVVAVTLPQSMAAMPPKATVCCTAAK
jgi:hypothetical protein